MYNEIYLLEKIEKLIFSIIIDIYNIRHIIINND